MEVPGSLRVVNHVLLGREDSNLQLHGSEPCVPPIELHPNERSIGGEDSNLYRRGQNPPSYQLDHLRVSSGTRIRTLIDGSKDRRPAVRRSPSEATMWSRGADDESRTRPSRLGRPAPRPAASADLIVDSYFLSGSPREAVVQERRDPCARLSCRRRNLNRCSRRLRDAGSGGAPTS